MLRKFGRDNTGDKDALYREEKSLILQMIGAAERVIRAFREYENKTLSEELMRTGMQEEFSRIQLLYRKTADLPIAPKEIREWSDMCALLAADIHDMTIIYGEDGTKERSPENRRLMMEDVIRRYETDLEAFRRLSPDAEERRRQA